MATNYFEQWSKQVFDWQRTLLDQWTDVNRLGMGMKGENLTENWENSIKFGEEMVKTSLALQEESNKMMLETQKQFWDNYFQSLRQTTLTNKKEAVAS